MNLKLNFSPSLDYSVEPTMTPLTLHVVEDKQPVFDRKAVLPHGIEVMALVSSIAKRCWARELLLSPQISLMVLKETLFIAGTITSHEYATNIISLYRPFLRSTRAQRQYCHLLSLSPT